MCWPLTKVNDYYFGPKQGKRLMCVSHNKSCTFVCIKNYIYMCVCVCTYVSVENRVRTYLILGSQGGSLDFSPEKQIIMARRVLLARRENVFFYAWHIPLGFLFIVVIVTAAVFFFMMFLASIFCVYQTNLQNPPTSAFSLTCPFPYCSYFIYLLSLYNLLLSCPFSFLCHLQKKK